MLSCSAVCRCLPSDVESTDRTPQPSPLLVALMKLGSLSATCILAAVASVVSACGGSQGPLQPTPAPGNAGPVRPIAVVPSAFGTLSMPGSPAAAFATCLAGSGQT